MPKFSSKSLYLLPFIIGITLSACSSEGDKSDSSVAPTPISSQKNTTKTVNESNPKSTDSASSAQETTAAIDGAKIFKRCQVCHTLEEGGRNGTGPNLYGIFGKTAGTNPEFTRFSAAMKASDVVWTEETMREYLNNPRKFMPGTSMTFAGIRKADELDALLIYLMDQTSR